MSGSVLDVYGGEFEFDNYVVRLHTHRGSDTGVIVSYGKNLTDVKLTSSTENSFQLKEYDTIKSKLEKAESDISAQQSKRRQILNFISQLKERNAILTEFDEALFAATVDTVTVFSDRSLLFRFKDGTEVQHTIS